MSNPHSTTHTIGSLNSGASFNTDEDASEMGHLSVSVSELNQLRQHVRSMRENMTASNKNLRPHSTSPTRHLEEVEIGRNFNPSSSKNGDGLVVSESALSPQERRRRFRLAIVGNLMFVLGSLLYVCVAHGDLEWAKDIQGIPTKVLNADDDATWRTWQRHQKGGQQGKEPKERRLINNHRALAMQQDEDMDYNDMLWQDLPLDIQLALEVLGHSRHTWNNAETSSIEVQPWANLTNEQKQAAKVIGYTRVEWDDEQERQEEMWEKTQEAYFKNDDARTATDGGDDRYEDEEDDRTVDDDGRGDDDRRNDDRRNDDRVDDDGRGDDDRRNDDRRNDDRYEDDDEEEEDDRVADDDRRGDDRYEDDDEETDDRYEDDDQEDDRYADDDLPDDDKTQTAGEVFDWYKESNKDPNYPEEVSTGAVTPRPTQAAKATNPPTTAPPKPAQQQEEKYTAGATAPEKPPEGYTIDGTPITNAPIPQEELTVAPQIAELGDVANPDDLMIWGDYDWEQLPDGVKKAFEILGYDEELWNTGGTAFTEDLYWEDLTPDQQAQAGVLGYTQKLWDQAEDENWDIVTGEQGDDDGEEDDGYEEGDDEYSEDGQPADDDQDPLVRLGYVEDDAESEAITLFFAAFCFMVSGVMNWIREKQVFHMWMVQGGVFGVLAALTMGFSDFASLLLQTVSVHCFLLQSIFMLRLRKTIRPIEGLENVSKALWGADILFCAGAFLQVVMVYWLHGDSDAYYELGLGYIEAMAAWFWFFTAAIYTMNTLALVNKSIHEEDNSDNQSQVSRTLTITRQHPNGESYTIRPAAIQLRTQPPCHDVVLT